MCPNGDTSGNNFDGRCVSITVSVTSPSSAVSSVMNPVTTTPPTQVNPNTTLPSLKPVRVKKPILNRVPLPSKTSTPLPNVKKPVVPRIPTVTQRPSKTPVVIKKLTPTPVMSQPRAPVAGATPTSTYDASKKLDYLMSYT